MPTDEDILDMIFNTEKEFTFGKDDWSPSSEIPRLDKDQEAELKKLEKEAIALADKNLFDESLQKLNHVLNVCDRYASAFNNRAQVLRLLGRSLDAINDLDNAIKWSPNTQILGIAYTQRAIIYKELGEIEKSNEDFLNGAKFGIHIAKKQVLNNPYAKLCSTMVELASKNI